MRQAAALEPSRRHALCLKNPVQAGMVEDPADYRWSGYSEAMAGKAWSRRGLVRIIGQMARSQMQWGSKTSAGNAYTARKSGQFEINFNFEPGS